MKASYVYANFEDKKFDRIGARIKGTHQKD